MHTVNKNKYVIIIIIIIIIINIIIVVVLYLYTIEFKLIVSSMENKIIVWLFHAITMNSCL